MTVYTTKQGKGHVQCYPFQGPPVTLHISDSILENVLSAVKNNTRVKGFYDVTPLVKFLWFDLVLDVLLRVTKQFLNLWLPPSRYKKPWFIGNKTKAIDKRLKYMEPPNFIQTSKRTGDKFCLF